MFWRGFLECDPRITFTTSALTGRRKILHQNPLSTFSECLDFVFQDVGGAQATGSYGQERERTERDGKEWGANGHERKGTGKNREPTGTNGNLRERSRLTVS